MSRPGVPPIVTVDEGKQSTRVRIAVGTAEVWIRATRGSRVLSVAIDEGEGEVNVQWSIRRARPREAVIQTGPFVQSPYPAAPTPAERATEGAVEG